MGLGGLEVRVKEFTPLLGVLGALCVASAGLYTLATSLSQQLEEGDSAGVTLSFPKSLEELRSLHTTLQHLKERHFYGVLSLFAAAYLYKQTFAIPGSVFLNVLAGALFGLWRGVPLVCCLTALGASCCYMLSRLFGRKLVWKYFSHRLQPLQAQLTSDQSSLLFLLISLRLFPMSPNWFLNIASPLVGVPLHLFFPSVLIGLLPYNLLCVQAGLVLSELHMMSVLDLRSILSLLGATLSLLATAVFIRRCKSRTKPPSAVD